MWFGKKAEKKQESPAVSEEKLHNETIENIEKNINEFQSIVKDLNSVVRPISFDLEKNAPRIIKGMNTNDLAADPFRLTVGNAKMVLDTFYKIEKSITDKEFLLPNSSWVACDVFVRFMMSEFFNLISTNLCTRTLSTVSKPFALYLLDLINKDNANEIIEHALDIVHRYASKYRYSREMNEDIALTYYSDFNNALFMAFYAPIVDKISRTIDMDSKALKYMLDEDAVKNIYHILDDESFAYLKSDPNNSIIIIRNFYKAMIYRDFDDLYMVFPDIISKSSSVLEKYCFDTEIKIISLMNGRHDQNNKFINSPDLYE